MNLCLERKTREHFRSIHTMNVSRIVHHYCMTGSADGDFRVWVQKFLFPSFLLFNLLSGPS